MKYASIIVGVSALTVGSPSMADSAWNESDISRSWEKETGMIFHADHQALVVDGATMRVVEINTNKILGEWVFVETASLPIFTNAVEDKTDWGTPLQYQEDYILTTGFIVVNERQSHFAFLRTNVSTSFHHQEDLVEANASINIPIIAFDSAGAADLFISTASSANDGDSGGGIFCSDPDWLGRNGEECCGYLAALQLRLDACNHDWWNRLFICVSGGAVGGFAWFKYCIGTCGPFCAALGPAAPPCLATCAKGCLLTAGVVGAEAAIVCVLASNSAYDACVDRELAEYYTTLADHGCELRSPETKP